MKNFYDQFILSKQLWRQMTEWMFVPTQPTSHHIRAKLEEALKKQQLIEHLKRVLMQLRPPAQQQQQGQQQTQQGQQQQNQGGKAPLPPDKLGVALVNAVAYFLETNIGQATKLPGRVREFDPQGLAEVLLDNYFRTHASGRQKIEKIFIQKVIKTQDNDALAEELADFVISLAEAARRSAQVYNRLMGILQRMLNIISQWLGGGGIGKVPMKKQLLGGRIGAPSPEQYTPQDLYNLVGQAITALKSGDYAKLWQILDRLEAALNNPSFATMPQYGELVGLLKQLRETADLLAVVSYGVDLEGEEEGVGGEEISPPHLPQRPPTTQQPRTAPQRHTPAPQTVSVPPLEPIGRESIPAPHEVVGLHLDAVKDEKLKEIQSKVEKLINMINEAIKTYVTLSANAATLLTVVRQHERDTGRIDELQKTLRLQSELFLDWLQHPPEELVTPQKEEKMEKQRWRDILGEAGRKLGRQLGRLISPQTPPQQPPTQPQEPQYKYPIITQLIEVKDQILPKLWELCQISGSGKTSIHNYIRRDNADDALKGRIEEINNTLQTISSRMKWVMAFGGHLENMSDTVRNLLVMIPEGSIYRAWIKNVINIPPTWKNIATNIKNIAQDIITHLSFNLVETTVSIINFFANKENREAWSGLVRGVEAVGKLWKRLREMELAIIIQNLEGLQRRAKSEIATVDEIRENIRKVENAWANFINAFYQLNFPAAKFFLSSFDAHLGGLESALVRARGHEKAIQEDETIMRQIAGALTEIGSIEHTLKFVSKDLETLERNMNLRLRLPPGFPVKGEPPTSAQMQKGSFPNPWRKVRGGGRGKRWSWDINLPRPIVTILQWWDRLTSQEKERVRRYIYEYWLSSNKDEKKEALQKLIQVAREMGIPVK